VISGFPHLVNLHSVVKLLVAVTDELEESCRGVRNGREKAEEAGGEIETQGIHAFS
jgi:hypothetical protein